MSRSRVKVVNMIEAMCVVEGRQRKPFYRHTRAFLREGVWNQQLSLGEETNIMEARKELHSLLVEDVMFDSREKEQVYMRGKKITFFGVMKEKTFTKVVEDKKTIYRVVETSAQFGGKQAIYRVAENSAEFGGKQAIYRVAENSAEFGGKQAIYRVVETSTEFGGKQAIYMVDRETFLRQREGRQIISTELVVFDGVAVNTEKTFHGLGGSQISSTELVESFNWEDDNIATFWVVEGRALVEDKFVTSSMARYKSSREFVGNWISAKRFHGDFRVHETFFQVKQSDNQLGLTAVTEVEVLCYDKEFVVGQRQFAEGQSEMQDRNIDGSV